MLIYIEYYNKNHDITSSAFILANIPKKLKKFKVMHPFCPWLYIIYIRVCHAHACFIFNSICHFSYVLINSELIGLKNILEEAIFATGKPQFCLKWCFFPKSRLFSEKTSFHYIQLWYSAFIINTPINTPNTPPWQLFFGGVSLKIRGSVYPPIGGVI